MPRKDRAEAFVPTIGFNKKGRRSVLDIEVCPIATPVLNVGLKKSRENVLADISAFKRGATLLLRESTDRVNSDDGSFFQNNNSILPLLTNHVRENLSFEGSCPEIFLIDAYCGSGLFSITCSEGFKEVIGVEVSADSVKYAKLNAKANKVQNARFILGRAEKIFEEIQFPSEQTAMIIDPPRKGCDEAFLNQLLDFSPRRIIYVSCNVHTQARDLAYITRHDKGNGYMIDSIRGFDLFVCHRCIHMTDQ
ncbi:tRNA (uracil(54)-C(5))-methyltransferase [Neolecta irregularis DAH-3]|uniref:tRNA (Uracil(54)-C(5))-methyltransferase n=1 Tax=Neolecta irregularis (strain DAH-3) TaxID=1198029 RepID=A0A1U7LWN3_NEOID|nr:tRNA (uracil(54)-C(5))-methyltransferase [Neolecta irregularis DAH-3]|eukprot:OLL27086.1 tRNA (uracil(54)-C(5))-methyltransferase [Neolecta irregularis DAH-3]